MPMARAATSSLDAKGYAVQTMRSWLTFQPGEKWGVSAVTNEEARPRRAFSGAGSDAERGRKLAGFDRIAADSGSSKEIQPMLDRHCVRCH